MLMKLLLSSIESNIFSIIRFTISPFHRPIVSQKYQVKEPVAISATNRPSKPLSDEFSDETFGENGNNINGFSHNNR